MTIPRTLVLNKDYIPISIFPLHHIDAGEAVTRVLNGTCLVVAEYDRLIQTPNLIMKWPSIVIRTTYLNFERLAVLRKEALFYRDGKKCAYCGCSLSEKKSTIDHVKPKTLGGKHVWDNVVISCGPCNHSKGMVPPNYKTGLWVPRVKPYKPTYWQLLEIRRNFPITVYHESWIDFLGSWKAKIIIEN